MLLDSNLLPCQKVKHYENGGPHFVTFSCYRRRLRLSKG